MSVLDFQNFGGGDPDLDKAARRRKALRDERWRRAIEKRSEWPRSGSSKRKSALQKRLKTGLTAKQRRTWLTRAHQRANMRAALWHRARLAMSETEFRARLHEIATKVARELDELFPELAQGRS